MNLSGLKTAVFIPKMVFEAKETTFVLFYYG